MAGVLLHAILAVGVLLLLAVSYFYVYLPAVTHHGETITVPNVEGLPIDKVAEFLKQHDLRYEVNDSSYSSDYPPLTVLKQYPEAGSKVKENRKIYVSVNRKQPPTVLVPDLVDRSLINAEAELKGNELKRGKIHLVRGPFLNVVKEMRINGKPVSAGTRIPKGTVIDLVVMDGGSPFLPAPNVLGFSYEDAKFNILGMNLNVGRVRLLGDTTGVRAVVIKQKPLPNENIKVGDIVDLWIGDPNIEILDDDQYQDDEDL